MRAVSDDRLYVYDFYTHSALAVTMDGKAEKVLVNDDGWAWVGNLGFDLHGGAPAREQYPSPWNPTALPGLRRTASASRTGWHSRQTAANKGIRKLVEAALRDCLCVDVVTARAVHFSRHAEESACY